MKEESNLDLTCKLFDSCPHSQNIPRSTLVENPGGGTEGFLGFHLSTFFSFLQCNSFAYIPFSILRQDSNPRPLGCKSLPLTTRLHIATRLLT